MRYVANCDDFKGTLQMTLIPRGDSGRISEGRRTGKNNNSYHHEITILKTT